MLLVGTDDGTYAVTDIDDGNAAEVRRVHDAGSVMRIRDFEGIDGVFAASDTGLYHSPDGTDWTTLDVPRERVYAVGASPAGTLYAGTRPAAIYAAEWPDDGRSGLEWRECDDFQELPSREDWRLPRHENLAQVRDVHVHPGAPDRVVAGVEVGGVHVGGDGGDAWTERRDGVDDDVHELAVVDENEFVAATGFGLFRTTDAGQSWTRLDEAFDQRYFRSVGVVDGNVYAGAALAHTATWDDDDADPGLFVSRDGAPLEPVDHPRPDETITGITSLDGQLVVGTHRGTVLVQDAEGWAVVASLPVPDDHAVSYTPLLAIDG